MRKPILFSAAILCASSAGAHAVGFKTQFNCAGDYYAYCSQHSVGTPELRKCMRANGPRLSKGCINALIEDGEVSRADVEREKEKLLAAKANKAKPADPKKTDAALKKPDPEPKKADVALKKPDAVKKPDAEPKKTAVAVKTPAEPKKAVKLAAAPAAAKPQPAAKPVAPAVKPTQPVAPVSRQTVSLDQKTFDALKTRGVRFVADDDDENPDADSTPVTMSAPIEARLQPVRSAAGSMAAAEADGVAQTSDEPASETAMDPEGSDVAAAGEASGEAADTGDDALPKTIRYPAGRMSLGHRIDNGKTQEEPTSWWDTIVRTFTGE